MGGKVAPGCASTRAPKQATPHARTRGGPSTVVLSLVEGLRWRKHFHDECEFVSATVRLEKSKSKTCTAHGMLTAIVLLGL